MPSVIAELNQVLASLKDAVRTEDVFGIPAAGTSSDELRATIKKTFLRLSQLTDPDLYPGDADAKELATEAHALLQAFYEQALGKVQSGEYGRAPQRGAEANSAASIATTRRHYRIEKALAQGDLATVFEGVCEEGEGEAAKIVIKLVEDPADNDLMQNEARIIKLLHAGEGVQTKHLPVLMDDFRTDDGRIGLVMRRIDGYDLHSVREKYVKGIPPRHIIWLFRRLLSVLGYAHSQGILHGNVDPAHIMIRPSDHNVWLIDWTCSIYKPASTGQGFRILNEKYSAPEVAEKKPPLPSSDLFSAARCMVFALGGNPETAEMPAEVDERIQRFIRFFLKESPMQRAQDAWEMYGMLDDLRAEVYGPHEFIPFEM